MSDAKNPEPALPGARKLSPKEQAQRAVAQACLANDNQPSCSKVLWSGIFFDGTNNNMDRDIPDKGHSNVVALYRTYKNITRMPKNLAASRS